jgi:glutamate/tyrosine decarboxylase-like PLP-dependent enzyme
VLARAGWDVEREGLIGAPELTVVLGDEAHATVLAALQMAGLGSGRARRIECDEQGRMRAQPLREVLSDLRDRPVLVSAQAGNVNTGAFDPMAEIAEAVREHPNAWLHVDGAFGLWAATSPTLSSLTIGMADADSWTTDGHKWLNVPYDCGVAIVRDPQAHQAAVSYGAAYYAASGGSFREPGTWVPDSSRRSRAFAVYAALRQLGRAGIAELVDGCCALARRMAEGLRDVPGATILNEVVLNQVLVRFAPQGADAVKIDDGRTREMIAAVQQEGTCWVGGTRWHGMAAMRVSVSNWSTTDADVDLSIAAIRRCAGSLPTVIG